jgi:hypothetical protein
MVEIRLKRTGENACCTFGELRIPKLKFGCRTLELKDGSGLQCKQSCRIPEGNYTVNLKINHLGFFVPAIKYRIRGFAVKPKFDLLNHHFSNMLNGDIAIGSEYNGQYDIKTSDEVRQAFSDACRQLYIEYPQEEFVLKVYKQVKDYQMYENDFFKDVVNQAWDFLDNKDDDDDDSAQ